MQGIGNKHILHPIQTKDTPPPPKPKLSMMKGIKSEINKIQKHNAIIIALIGLNFVLIISSED